MKIIPLPKRQQPAEELLAVRHLRKSFRRRAVVRDVSFALNRGEVLGLLGPNGAGKTTVFYIITGLIAPDAGEVWFGGRPITHLPVYRRARGGLSYLPQDSSIFRGLSVAQNLLAILEISERRNGSKARERLEELLAEFMITHLRDVPGAALSGGERRRVEIARALAADPDAILLDEPFAGIDPIALGDIHKLVAHLKDRQIGVLLTDHNVRETLNLVDRAAVIHDGRIIACGRPEEIVADQSVRRVYLGDNFSWREGSAS